MKDYAQAARQLGITRARMSQVMGLLNLSPRVQMAVLSGKLAATERSVRSLTNEVMWESQRQLLSF